MKNSTLIVALGSALLLLLWGCAASPGRISVKKPIPVLNAPHGLGLRGYDSVAYFVDGKPGQGSDVFALQWHGATWRFASAEHLAMFTADPVRYAPQFGGYCAFAISRGTTADGDPEQWAIVDDQLYVNNNAFAMQLWNRERDANIAAGKINWPLIPKQPALH